MGITSSVGIIMTNDLEEKIIRKAEEQGNEFLSLADDRFEKEGANLHIFSCVKWSPEGLEEDSSEFKNLLESENEEGDKYYIVEACSEYPSNENTWGSFHENPFELCTSFTLEYNEN